MAIDGTKMAANASTDANRDFGRLAREILAEAAEIDRREDELYGSQRGDELPAQLRTREGRRQALREAKERLERERRNAQASPRDEDQPVTVELDPRRFVTRPQGRRAWVREGRRTPPMTRGGRAESPRTGRGGSRGDGQAARAGARPDRVDQRHRP